MDNNLTRKDFLLKSSKAAVGITAIAGATSLITTAVNAKPPVTPWPWPYTQLDPEAVRIQAHNLYWNGKDCCAGVFGAIVQALATAIGEPWASLPMEIMLYGRGGVSGWGTLCGAINGGLALISLATEKTPSGALLTELQGWYTEAELPSDEANQIGVSGGYLVHNFDGDLVQNISGSPLCHTSVTEWCIAANKKVSDVERKERCARIAGDCAAKTVKILNEFFAGTFVPSYVDPASVTACLSCHGSTGFNNVMTRMDCQPCHGDPHNPQAVETLIGSANAFELSQNYPNPFNPNTKIQFAVSETEKVSLAVYDIQGRLIRNLVDHELYQRGKYEVTWDGRDSKGNIVASGVYFAKMHAGKFANTKKMIMNK
ncbi:MAG: T9SS type A sorting domain-containing protein [Ignavibacteriota bacterium]|jgi:hypothetical protein|nr:MAG: T9SS C-terminal target domain-containing protein [Chlorobiota bacterium]MBE7476334.1 C-GCAxxG-C-C family protein [Ignavibacteriales bacterium]MBL1124183.1 T9SS C-terminal target domain-containing protein [Ignavibacteriota bacterium]MBV6420207.1 hypothetical protein [Ignavibacteriaceae bacterium]MCE7857353.1 T9SS C-terminal target domain-containing protein [Ignavibacteria bacterium CHB3]MEB2297637.1 C-GCAxxG-C-C family protein [Ignavibacteria bacterium]